MIWCYTGDGRGDASWEVYNDEDAIKLENAYQALHNSESNEGEGTANDSTVILQRGSTTYVCDVSTMEQTNVDSGFVRNIHRGWPQVQEEKDEEEKEEQGSGENEKPTTGTGKKKTKKKKKKILATSDPKEMTAAAPSSYICPITSAIMLDPVMTMAGSTYERKSIEWWLRNHDNDPLTNKDLSGPKKKLIDNRALRDCIQEWRDEYQKKQQHQQQSNYTNQSNKEEEKKEEMDDSKPPAKNTLTTSTPANNTGKSSLPATSEHTNPVASIAAAESSTDDLQEGEERLVQGFSTNATYTVKLLRGVYSCSCPSWRYAGGPIDTRSCKHLREIRGVAAEEERLLGMGPAREGGASKKRKEPEPYSLRGQTICFTGALQTMTRTQAQTMARGAGAQVTQSVTRATTVLVVGKRPGVKLSNSDASLKCDTWTEEEFIAAGSNNSTSSGLGGGFRSLGGGSSSRSRSTSPTTATAGDHGTIPSRIMLASKFDKKKTDPTGYLLSEKLDGMRALWDGHAGKMWSRQGKAIYTPDWWTAALPRGVFLDGELWLGRGKFQECMSITRRQNKPRDWDRITYLVYDAPDDVNAHGRPNTGEGYEARHKKATRAIADAANNAALAGTQSYARVHPFEICRGIEHLRKKLKEIEAINGEGLMLRKSQSKYRGGRSSDLLKVKSSHDDEAVVQGYETGKGRNSGRVGALQVVGRAGKPFKVGTGLSDHQRENPPAIGSVITYSYFELTNSGVPRFPAFVRVRPDVEASDITGS